MHARRAISIYRLYVYPITKTRIIYPLSIVGLLVALPLLLVHPHREAEGVDGEGEHDGGALLCGDGVQGLKKAVSQSYNEVHNDKYYVINLPTIFSHTNDDQNACDHEFGWELPSSLRHDGFFYNEISAEATLHIGLCIYYATLYSSPLSLSPSRSRSVSLSLPVHNESSGLPTTDHDNSTSVMTCEDTDPIKTLSLDHSLPLSPPLSPLSLSPSFSLLYALRGITSPGIMPKSTAPCPFLLLTTHLMIMMIIKGAGGRGERAWGWRGWGVCRCIDDSARRISN